MRESRERTADATRTAAAPLRPRVDGAAAAPDGATSLDPAVSAGDAPARINLSWLLRLRWGAALGQLAVILASSRLLGVELPLPKMLGLVALGAASNLACGLWASRATRVGPAAIALIMAFDVLLLTGMFRWSGGASNPFTSLYLVNIALATVVLPPSWTWGLLALAVACFSALFLEPADPHAMHAMHGGRGDGAGRLQLHLRGMWLAFVLAAGFIAWFVQRVTRALTERDRELERARGAIARNERLASLATLAAGAAHELSTPLATIAIAAKELERELDESSASESAVGDVALIRGQVERCREILVQMAAEAGATTGEDFAPVSTSELVRASLRGIPDGEGARLDVEEGPAATVIVPIRAVAQAMRAVVKNALQASPASAPVAVRARPAEGRWELEVRDSGAGMPPEVLARAFDPFFTTKATGQGMGLGLFLARDVLARVGGELELRSREGAGTVATIRLPLHPGGQGASA